MKLLRADLAISSWWPKDSLCSWNNVRARTAPNLWEKRKDNPSMRDPKRRIRDHHEVSYDCMRQERKGQQDDPIRRTAPHRGTNGLMVTRGYDKLNRGTSSSSYNHLESRPWTGRERPESIESTPDWKRPPQGWLCPGQEMHTVEAEYKKGCVNVYLHFPGRGKIHQKSSKLRTSSKIRDHS